MSVGYVEKQENVISEVMEGKEKPRSQNDLLKFRDCEKAYTALHDYPTAPGETIVASKFGENGVDVFQIPEKDYKALLMEARSTAHLLQRKLDIQRCALVSDPSPILPAHIRLVPLHGLSEEWQSITAAENDYNEVYPGYISSLNGPKMDSTKLESIKATITALGSQRPESYIFHGDKSDDNLFAKIVRNEIEQWRVWEDDEHVAFLTPFPNTPGFTVLVPRKHLNSDVFALETEDYEKLIMAAREVANLLKKSLGAEYCGMIFEGYEIDYTHVKLIPVFCSDLHISKAKASDKKEFREEYEGSISSLCGPKAETVTLEKMSSFLKTESIIPPRSWENPEDHAIAISN